MVVYKLLENFTRDQMHRTADKVRARVEPEAVVFSIPIDFCFEFWNNAFPSVLYFTEGIFVAALARAFQWCRLPFYSYSSFSCCQLNLDILYYLPGSASSCLKNQP